MALATIESFRIFLLGSASELSDALLEKILYSAKLKVQKDGVDVSHEEFATLQEYYAANLLEIMGHIQGTLASKSVADVSESYVTATEKTYIDLYRQTLLGVVGKKKFIV